MKVAVVYATVEGQTRRIAERIAARVAERGHAAELVDADSERAVPCLEAADRAILAAPVHGGSYPGAIARVASAARDRLAAIPSAFVSVSLAIIGEPEERAEAEAYPDRLAERTGWTPAAVHHTAGALRYSEYDFFKRWIMRRVARTHGYGAGEGQDHAFTDWAALDRFVDDFLGAAG